MLVFQPWWSGDRLIRDLVYRFLCLFLFLFRSLKIAARMRGYEDSGNTVVDVDGRSIKPRIDADCC